MKLGFSKFRIASLVIALGFVLILGGCSSDSTLGSLFGSDSDSKKDSGSETTSGSGATDDSTTQDEAADNSIIGVYYGEHGSILVFSPDKTAEYYYKGQDAPEEDCPWWVEGEELKWKSFEMNCEISAEMKNGLTKKLRFTSGKFWAWTNENYTKISDDGTRLSKEECDKLISEQGGNDDNSSSDSGDSSSDDSNDSGSSDSEDELVGFGDTKAVSDSLEFKINGCSKRSSIEYSGIMESTPSGDDATFLLVSITMKNTGKKPEDIDLDHFNLVSAKEERFVPSWNVMWEDEYFGDSSLDLSAGTKKTKKVVFEVPKDIDVSGSRLEFKSGGFFSSKIYGFELK